MLQTSQSSGDLIADRRASYAAMLAEGGDHAAAADLMVQALEHAPDWPAGWDLLGRYREKAGDLGGAVVAWQRLDALDPDGRFGACLKLAAHGVTDRKPSPATAYVESLFDDYASRFESELVQQLDYVVPQKLDTAIRSAMGKVGLTGFARGLDLGCGTGLMGERLRRDVSHLTGIDLSARMLKETGRKGIYDRLERAELTAFMAGAMDSADLIVAADVFMYCGELQPVVAAAATALRGAGLFAFSVEAHDGPERMRLRPSLRYAHAPWAVEADLVDAGFDVLSLETTTIRRDRGAPVEGLIVVAGRPDAETLPVARAGGEPERRAH